MVFESLDDVEQARTNNSARIKRDITGWKTPDDRGAV